MYPSLIKVCYVVPFTLSSKTSCNMKRQRAKRQIKKKKKEIINGFYRTFHKKYSSF